MSQRRRRLAYRAGRRAELLAALLLRAKGYRILARGYRTAFGEIDIIAQRGQTLVAVEVKTRAGVRDSLEAVTPRQQKRIERTLLAFLSENKKMSQFFVRFDVIAVHTLMALPIPLHLRDAWRPQ